MKTILITGASSGYGLETARYFHDQGWTVIATMRRPQEGILPVSDRIRLLPLDVTSRDSIEACLAAAGPIDVLVNNAGIGMAGAFEASPFDRIRALFETNTLGVMAMTQAALPGLRAHGGGVIVNITSSVALGTFPFVAAYTASKVAIEAFSRTLAPELAPFGIRVKAVEPGHAPTTRFAENTGLKVEDLIPEAYADHARTVFGASATPGLTTREIDVAEAVFRAATDGSDQLQYPAGPDAIALWEASR